MFVNGNPDWKSQLVPYWVLPSFSTKLDRIISGLFSYRVLVGFTRLYWACIGFSDCLWVGVGYNWYSLGFTGFNRVLLGYNGFLLIYGRFERVLVSLSGLYGFLLGFTGL